MLLNREFVVHCQPIVLLADSTAIGHEALVRWNHPTRGLLSPIEFLAVAEESGLIVELGEQVLEHACELVAERPDLPGPVSINHSASNIQSLCACVNLGWESTSFTRHLSDDHSAGILSDGLAGLAGRLHLMRIAEGVESLEEANTLLGYGWTHAQGHLYCRPQPLVCVSSDQLGGLGRSGVARLVDCS